MYVCRAYCVRVIIMIVLLRALIGETCGIVFMTKFSLTGIVKHLCIKT